MIGRIAVLSALVAAPATFAAGYWQAQHQAPDEQLSTIQVNAPVIAKPGSGAATAARYFASLNAPPPPPPPPPSAFPAAAAPAGPPPIDVAVEFRREVTAVLTEGQPHIVLAGGRKLARGDVYRDGWRVRDFTAQTAVLAKGRDTRNINLFSAPPRDTGVQLASASPIFTGPLGLTNGLTAEQRTAALQAQLASRISPDALRALQQAMQNGGLRIQQGGGGGRGGQGGGGQGGGGGRGGQGGFNNNGFNGGFTAGGRRGGVQIPAPPSPPPAPPAPPVQNTQADD